MTDAGFPRGSPARADSSSGPCWWNSTAFAAGRGECDPVARDCFNPPAQLQTRSQTDPRFPNTRRFVVRGVLGRGAFGTVYALTDRHTGAELAAKLLHRDHPKALARFKNEFRALADLHHPNLVRFYELHADGEQWFFTMEKLNGRDPLTWLIGNSSAAPTFDTAASDISAEFGESPPPQGPLAKDFNPPREPDWERTRSIFAQIARGLCALHEAGLIHRDLKPSNVLVDESGHTKLLDFGLAQQVERAEKSGPAGTLPYMAPELWNGGSPQPAADWYAMGVTLHQAMTGKLPLRTPDGVQLAELAGEDCPARAELWGLCKELLRTDPSDRPGGAAVLQHFGETLGPTPLWTAESSAPLVGRASELEQLERRLDRSRTDRSQFALVLGLSGVGKSALARAFCGRARERGALILAGRCFQQEVAPLKALDGIVDALAQALIDDPTLAALIDEVVERCGSVLGYVFPVLQTVPVFSAVSSHDRPSDAHEVRRQAFEGLAELMLAIAEARGVVMLVDDLQWGDGESADRIARLLDNNARSGLLVVGTCRTDEQSESTFLEHWARHRPLLAEQGRTETIELSPLTAAAAAELAREVLSRGGGAHVDANRIAQESGGSPFLIEELARQAQRVQSGSASLWMGLKEAVHARIASLPEDARAVLELVAISGRPVDATTLGVASDIGSATFQALDALRAAHLIRTRERAGTRTAEIYHDRIRETLLAVLADDAQKRRHLELARALQNRPALDHGGIARHLAAAGATDEAVEHALLGADAAEETLTFEVAAELWATAIRGLPEGDARLESIRRRRAEALIHCGRAAEAAPILEALAGESGSHADLRRAAEQWMISGHLDRGCAVLQEVLQRDGLRWPAGPGATMAAVFRDLSVIALQRGRPKPPPHDEKRLSQVDTCWSGVRGLSAVDHVRGLYFAVHGMRLALAAGEPHRIAKIGMFFAAQLRSIGLPGGPKLFERYRAQAMDSDDASLKAYVDYLEGYVQLQHGDSVAASAALELAIARFDKECTGVGWEVSVALSMLCETLSEQGDMRKLADVTAKALRRAEALSDIHAAHGIRLFLGLGALANDRLDEARRHYAELPRVGMLGGFHYTHFVAELCQCLIEIYESREARAWERMESLLPKLDRSGLGRSPFVKCRMLSRRGMCAVAVLAASDAPPEPKQLRKVARNCVRGLEKLGRADALAEAIQLRAALASIEGDTESSVALLEDAQTKFDALGLVVRGLLCRLRRRQLENAPQSDIDGLLAAVAERGIARPERWAAAHAPGFSIEARPQTP